MPVSIAEVLLHFQDLIGISLLKKNLIFIPYLSV